MSWTCTNRIHLEKRWRYPRYLSQYLCTQKRCLVHRQECVVGGMGPLEKQMGTLAHKDLMSGKTTSKWAALHPPSSPSPLLSFPPKVPYPVFCSEQLILFYTVTGWVFLQFQRASPLSFWNHLDGFHLSKRSHPGSSSTSLLNPFTPIIRVPPTSSLHIYPFPSYVCVPILWLTFTVDFTGF